MYKGVIFDLDGTLLNTLEDLAEAGNYALEKQGLPVHEIEKYKYFIGNGIPKLIERIMPQGSSQAQLEQTHRLFSEYYEAHKCDKTAPYEGITELIDNIRAKGIKTAVATNKAHKFAVEMVKNYFGDSFDMIIGQSDGRPKKPDPACVLEIQHSWSFAKNEILYVGDSGVDMLTAKNGGFDSCGVLWGYREREELLSEGAVYLADNAEELFNYIYG